eukprot:GHVS01042458.1.p1 GENE.GHVS01042458.1~~GHVS01042458.1.p1  ORF type:complete len:669 (+),score=130.38 GHVS01042458.1:290-2008(+)
MCQLSVCPPAEVVGLLCHVYRAQRPPDGPASLSGFVAFLSLHASSSTSAFPPNFFSVCPFVSAVYIISANFSSLPHGSLQTLSRLLEQQFSHPSLRSWLCMTDSSTNSFCGCVLGSSTANDDSVVVGEGGVGCGVGDCCTPHHVIHSLCDLLHSSMLSQWVSTQHVQIPFRLICCITNIVHNADKWSAFMSFLFAFLFSSSLHYMSELLSLLSRPLVDACSSSSGIIAGGDNEATTSGMAGGGGDEATTTSGISGGGSSNLSAANNCVLLFFHLNTLSDVLALVGSIDPLYSSDRCCSLPPPPPSLSYSSSPPRDLLPELVRTFLQFPSLFSSSSPPQCYQLPSTQSTRSIGPHPPDLSTSSSFSSSLRPPPFALDESRVRKCWELSRSVILQCLSLLLFHRPPADVSQVIDLISVVPSVESKRELIRLIVHAATDCSQSATLTAKTHVIVNVLNEMHQVLDTVEDSGHMFSPILPQFTDLIGTHLTTTSSQQQNKPVVRSLLFLCSSRISRARSYGISIVSKLLLLPGLNATVVVLPLLLAANNCRTYPSFAPPPCSPLCGSLSTAHFFTP